MKRPNSEMTVGFKSDYEHNGENNFSKKFSAIYSALLDFSYQSITENGRYFNKFNNEDKNLCYIPEKGFEIQLDKFMNTDNDGYKILVGFTGIGKTTLLKNYFGIRGRNPFIDKKNRVIAYKSFHSERINSEDVVGGVSKIDKIISGFVSNIIECLIPDIDYENIDWVEFGKYVKENKGDVINRSDKIPGYKYDIEQELRKLCREDPFEYYSCLLKYLMRVNDKEKDLILIFDNIESVNLKFHIPILEKIFSFNTCLSYNKDRNYSVKVIISMRGYTFRYNLFRQGEAYRIANEDVIIKDSIPDLIQLIERRFEVIEKDSTIMDKIKSHESWSDAKNELLHYIKTLDFYYNNLLTGLTHDNISRTAKLLFKIATNNRWLCIDNEPVNPSRGSFIAKSEDYNVSNKEAVMRALIYGEENVYVDYEDNILPNVLHSHYEEMPECELLCLYVLAFYMRTNVSNDAKKILYGNTKISGKDAIAEIKRALCKTDDRNFDRKINYIISYLYRQGLLLHSIYEPEVLNENTENYERKYDASYGLYISSRARTILGLLEKSSIILEFYRDDIDTNLYRNTQLSASLTQTEKLIYIIQYINFLFEIEMRYIKGASSDLFSYKNCFEQNFLVSKLMKGVMISFKKYYGIKDKDYYDVFKELQNIMLVFQKEEEKLGGEICFDETFKKMWKELREEGEIIC